MVKNNKLDKIWDPPLVSIIILNWNGEKYLRKCTQSVLETNYPLLEIIVSDNGSTDNSVRMIKTNYKNVILIENNANLGFCKGNNIAIRCAKGDIIILLNNDTYVDENWVSEIVKAAENPKVGIIGCKLYFANTNVIQSAGASLHPSGYWNSRAEGAFQEDNGQLNGIKDVDFVSGAALAIKRAVINRIGLLDPNFYSYYEDVDWCYRAKKAGYRVCVANKAVVYHFVSVSWGSKLFKQSYLCERNRLYFIIKHHSGLDLLNSLTFYDIKFMIEKAKEILSAKHSVENDEQKTITINGSSRSIFASMINWFGARLFASLTIPLLTLKLRRSIKQTNRYSAHGVLGDKQI